MIGKTLWIEKLLSMCYRMRDHDDCSGDKQPVTYFVCCPVHYPFKHCTTVCYSIKALGVVIALQYNNLYCFHLNDQM